MAEETKEISTEDLSEILKVRREKLAQLVEAGKDPFVITKFDVTHHSAEIKDNFEALEGKTVTIAGRLMQKRVMGKASFCNVQDLQGNIQCYVARDSIGEDSYKDFKKYDIGDIVGVSGEVFMPRRLPCFPRAFRCCRRNSMASPIPICATVSVMSI